MPIGRRRSTRSPSPAPPIYVVSSGGDVQQVFADHGEAERFAREIPGARITRHHVRRSVDEAMVVFDRRVVVTSGATVLDRTNVLHQFVDDPLDTPDPADVEWFHDAKDSGWHTAGFGVDKGPWTRRCRARSTASARPLPWGRRDDDGSRLEAGARPPTSATDTRAADDTRTVVGLEPHCELDRAAGARPGRPPAGRGAVTRP